jgi:glycosyltransferase involved in cell wall biosynthesis
MVCDIAFLHRPDEPSWSGKRRGTEALIAGLRKIGVKVAYTTDQSVRAHYYAVDSIDELHLLPNVEKSRQITWIHRDMTGAPKGRIEFDRPGHLFADSQFVANAWPTYEPTVLPECVVIPGPQPVIKGQTRALYVGRVCRSKGIPLLLKAMAFMQPCWHLDVVGSVMHDFMPLIKSLRLQCTNLPKKERYNLLLGRTSVDPGRVTLSGDVLFRDYSAGPKATVTFHGAQPYWRVQRFYAGAKVVAIPSQHEPFGRAVIEALAHGVKPVAIKGSGGPEEILPRYFLCEHDPLRLADHMRHFWFKDDLRQLAAPYEASVIAQRFMEALNGNPTHHQPGAEQPTTTPRGPAG